MYLLEIANDFIASVQEIAFGLSLVISGLFLLEYKKFSEEQKRIEMIDRFLNES